MRGGVYYLESDKKENDLNQETVTTQEKEVVVPVSGTPVVTSQNTATGALAKEDSTLKIFCDSKSCNTSGVNSTRSDFFVTQDNRKIKVLIDIETKLRYVRGVDSETPGMVEDVIKWADFYPMIDGPIEGGMPFSTTIYGSWVDNDTFKAEWVKWQIG